MSIENVPLFCRCRRRFRAIYAVHIVYVRNKSIQVRNSSVSVNVKAKQPSHTTATKQANCSIGNNGNSSARSQEKLRQN